MRSVSLALFALIANSMALPSAPVSQDMEGQVHSWASDWHRTVPRPSTDAFSVVKTDLEGDAATKSSTKSSTATSTVGSAVLSKRRPAEIASRSSASTTTRPTTTTTTRPTTTTTTTKATTSSTATSRPSSTTTSPKTSSTTARSSIVDAQIQTTTTRSGTSSTTTTKITTTTTSTRSSTTTSTTTLRTSTIPTTTTRSTTTTTTSKTTTAPAATRTINVTGMTYQNAMMAAHNAHRANHSIPLLNWNQDLANIAQDIANNCVYGHNVTADGGGYGQNIGAGAPGNAAAGLITNLMYNGEINYYPLPYGEDDIDLTNFHLWGHYSQLVWSDTTDVGCYTRDCSATGLSNTGPGVAPYFTVCNYGPPGNYVGEFSSVAAPNPNGQTVVIVGS